MIKKIKSIKKLAVFKDFEWDQSVLNKDGKLVDFKQFNIIYGRNYSGKTTLSRIIRSLETGSISEKYDSPEFEVEFSDGTVINQSNLISNNQEIRVFNEDFVKENLSFLKDTNIDGEIRPFAILGGNNATLQAEIDEIKKELGSEEEGNETGLYREKKEKVNVFSTVNENYEKAKNELENKLKDKATRNKNIAIKYNQEYGYANYDISKLNSDIDVILSSYTPIDNEQLSKLHYLIKEQIKPEIPSIVEISIDVNGLSNKVKYLIERKVGDSQKIEQLVRDNELNRWVKEGRTFHRDKNLKVCAFCGHEIKDDRWAELDKHFDEESEKLEKDIDELIQQILDNITVLEKGLGINKNAFYSEFHSKLDAIISDYDKKTKEEAKESLNNLLSQLKERKNDLFHQKTFKDVYDFTLELKELYIRYKEIEKESNEYSRNLNEKQKDAKEQLRLNEVYCFTQAINYSAEKKKIDELKKELEQKETEKNAIEEFISGKLQDVKNKENLMNDEEKGAKKVEEYLNNFFGHQYLSFTAIEDSSTTGGKYRFEITRNGTKAYNLSEGECSLIAFCYFMAKLEDVNTYGKKPIIWIDDPISSLDSNHVFFVYSLINGEIVEKEKCSQLFVSTHNLNFLKYLKRLPGADKEKNDTKEDKRKFRYLLIKRNDNNSSIELMPKYMQEYVTEFNFLFEQIYKCSQLEIDEANYVSFYNFGNNARKFLELYLYYKYPDSKKDQDKYRLFFGDDTLYSILTNRLINEYSHLSGIFERGETLTEIPEMKKVAQLIVNTIKQKDHDQYKALLRSIGVDAEDNEN